jgi:hypothetical protein
MIRKMEMNAGSYRYLFIKKRIIKGCLISCILTFGVGFVGAASLNSSFASTASVNMPNFVEADDVVLVDGDGFKGSSLSPNLLWLDYPFSRDDRRKCNTVWLNSSDKTVDKLKQTSDIWPLVKNQHGPSIRRFSVEDEENIEGLRGIKGDFGFHFLGKTSSNLGGLYHIFEPGFVLQHLDVAVQVPDDAFRTSILGNIIHLFGDPSLDGLETLSLRFMGLNDNHLETLVDKILEKPRKLKKIVLSFNAIKDKSLNATGNITRLIEDVNNVPFLELIDLKGNDLSNPSEWDLNDALAERRKYVRKNKGTEVRGLRLGFNELTVERIEGAQARTSCLKGLVDFEPRVSGNYLKIS